MLLCVVNLSEGRDRAVLDRLAAAAGADLLDLHADAGHHRAVLTLAGEQAVRPVAAQAVATIDLRRHAGAHPRMGAVDVVPFVPIGGTTLADAASARDRFMAWFSTAHGVPCFAYGPERSLPELRRDAFSALAPDAGPPRPHPSAGATAVGARAPLVAYNVWLAPGADLASARAVAARVRRPGALRALGLDLGDRVQVSMNLVAPETLGPADAYDLVAAEVARIAPGRRNIVAGAELVGLLPASVLAAVPRRRWAELGLAEDRTIQARLAARARARGAR